MSILSFKIIFRPVSGDRLVIVAGGFPPSSTYTVLVYRQCWRRIFLPRHALLKQARLFTGNGFRILKHVFRWILFEVMDVGIFSLSAVYG